MISKKNKRLICSDGPFFFFFLKSLIFQTPVSVCVCDLCLICFRIIISTCVLYNEIKPFFLLRILAGLCSLLLLLVLVTA